MALEIFKLVGSIFVDSEEADKSIAKTDKNAEGLGKKLLDGVGTAAKWGAGLAAGAGAAVGAVSGLAAKVTDTTSAIADSAQRTGVTAESFQKYAYAAKMSGMETETLEKAMIKSQKSFADAKTGSKTLQDSYKQLGIDINSIGNSSDAFDATVSALANMQDETQRNALANDLFGKSYAELAPLLNEGSTGIEKLKQEAVDMGAVMSNDSVASGEKFGDTIDKLKSSFGGIVNSVGTTVIPILQKFADGIINNMPMIQQVFSQLGPVFTDVLGKLLPPLMELGQTIAPMIMSTLQTILPLIIEIVSTILPIFTELLQTLLPPLMQIISALLPPLLELIKALMPILQVVIDLLKPILDVFISLLAPIISLISTAITPLISVIAELLNMALVPLLPIIQILGSAISGYLTGAFNGIGAVVQNITNIFSGLIDFITGVFTGNWEKAFGGLVKIFENIFGGIVNIAKAPINNMIGLINGFIKGINKLQIPDWVPEVGGKGINLPTIPTLAEGGLVNKGQLFIANEAGPELVASYGSKSGVMNNDQIVESVTKGVYAAVIEALSALPQSQLGDIVLNINSKEFARATAPDLSTEINTLNKSGARKVGVAYK